MRAHRIVSKAATAVAVAATVAAVPPIVALVGCYLVGRAAEHVRGLADGEVTR